MWEGEVVERVGSRRFYRGKRLFVVRGVGFSDKLGIVRFSGGFLVFICFI